MLVVVEVNKFDVVICGGGVAGLSLGLQLQRQDSSLSVAIVEPTSRPLPDSAHKVGESTLEAASGRYFNTILGLREHLDAEHLKKFGLRFFIGDGTEESFASRSEFGLAAFGPEDSYQIDRGVFENHLRALVDETSITFMEGAKVNTITLSKEDEHEIETTEGVLFARWVVDSMGRRCFLSRKEKLKKASPHRASAVWFRIAESIDVDTFDQAPEWRARVPNGRWNSTQHLLGTNYWVWMIPLANGYTSIGIVLSEEQYDVRDLSSWEGALAWLGEREPHLAKRLEEQKPVDFRTFRNFSFSTTQLFSSERWAIVGDAGTFPDPFYSPGLDLVAMGNTLICNLIQKDRDGTLAETDVQLANDYLIGFSDTITEVIRTNYPLMGKPVLMGAKILWDFPIGWAFTAPNFFNNALDLEVLPKMLEASSEFFRWQAAMQRMFREWGELSDSTARYEFVEYLEVPLLREIYDLNLQENKDIDELLSDRVHCIARIKLWAHAIFRLALFDVYPEREVNWEHELSPSEITLKSPRRSRKRGRKSLDQQQLSELLNDLEPFFHAIRVTKRDERAA